MKRKNQKIYSMILVSILLLIVCFGLLLSLKPKVSVKAENINRCQMYTDSDNLINAAGYEISETINDFVEYAQLLQAGDQIQDLEKVIPIEYLRATGVEKTYTYMGREYGFLIIHTTNITSTVNSQGCFWLYLIDFNWSNEDSRHRAEIKPLYQDEIEYICTEDGEESWMISAGLRAHNAKYFYIQNIGFETVVLNENSLNYGNEGYDKQTDDGVIIYQNEVYYKGVLNKNETGNWSELVSFGADVAFGVLDYINGLELLANITALKYVVMGYEILSTLFDLGKAIDAYSENLTTVICNNDKNTYRYLSKETQKNGSNNSYSKATYVTPADDIYLKEGGYAICESLLDDTNCRTRLVQGIRFNILSKEPNGENLYFNYNANGEPIQYGAYNQVVLYQDEKKEVQSDEEFSIYLLPHGDETVYFSPKTKGRFEIVLQTTADLSIEILDCNTQEIIPVTKQNGTFYANLDKKFESNGEYAIKIKANGEDLLGTINSKINFVPDYLQLGNNEIVFDNSQEEFFRLPSDINCYQKLECNGAYLRFYDASGEIISNSENSIRGNAQYCSIYFDVAYTGTVAVSYTREKDIKYIYQGNESNLTINCDSEIALLVPDVLAGYEFVGWYGTNTYIDEQITSQNVLNYGGSEISLYAKCRAINYTVTYIENGGDEIPDGIYTVENAYVLSSTEKAGYIFVGWYENADFSGDSVEYFHAGTTGNKTFYAYWLPEKIIVDLDLNSSAVGNSSITLVDNLGNTVTNTTIEIDNCAQFNLPVAQVENYSFIGWELNGELISTKNGESLSIFNFTDNITVKAIYSPDAYTIRILGDDGSIYYMIGDTDDESASISTTEGQCVFSLARCPNCLIDDLRITNPEVFDLFYREGYIYQYLTRGNPIDAGNVLNKFCWDEASPNLTNGDIIDLYVYYEKEIYTLRYQKPAEKYLSEEYDVRFIDVVYTIGEEIEEYPFKIRAGYRTTFKMDNTETVFNDIYAKDYTTNSEGNVTIELYAECDLIEYSIAYINADGVKETYNVEETVIFETPVLAGYRFRGWFLVENPSSEDIPIMEIPLGTTGNITLYAVWDKEYNITINYYTYNNVLHHFKNVKVINNEQIIFESWGALKSILATTANEQTKYNYHNGVWEIYSNNQKLSEINITQNAVSYIYTFTSENENEIPNAINLKWTPKTYNINYIYEFDALNLVRSYTYGIEKTLKISVYSSNLFDCFCVDSALTNAITKIEAGESGDKTFYLKWTYYGLGGMGKSGTYKVTDSGRFNQVHFEANIQIPTLAEIENYKFNSLEIRVQFELSENYDGYQYVFLYREYNDDGYINDIQIDNGDGRQEGVYMILTFNIPIESYGTTKKYYFLFGASGGGKDDWTFTDFTADYYLSTELPDV